MSDSAQEHPHEWMGERDPGRLAQMLNDSARAVLERGQEQGGAVGEYRG